MSQWRSAVPEMLLQYQELLIIACQTDVIPWPSQDPATGWQEKQRDLSGCTALLRGRLGDPVL